MGEKNLYRAKSNERKTSSFSRLQTKKFKEDEQQSSQYIAKVTLRSYGESEDSLQRKNIFEKNGGETQKIITNHLTQQQIDFEDDCLALIKE